MADEAPVLITLQAKDLTCSICICRYKCPTTLPCGHTFCMDCIESYWRTNKKNVCPVCQNVLSSKPHLSKNTDLASLLDLLQAQDTKAHENCAECTGPVPLKYCLPCMTPLCQSHLRLHEDSVLQRHLLVNPLNAAFNWSCRQHIKGLQHFCVSHCQPLCPDCVSQHKECQPVPLLDLYRKNKDKYEKKISEMNRDITKHKQVISEKKNNYHESQVLFCEIKENLTKEFRDMKDYLDKQERAAFWRIKQEQERAQKKINEIINPLITGIEKVKELKTQLEDRLQNDWIEVLKDTRAESDIFKPLTTTKDEVLFDENRIVDITHMVSEIKKSLFKHALLEQSHCPPKQVPEDTLRFQAAEASCGFVQHPTAKPQEKCSNKFLQWARNVFFDEETISCRLSYSRDLKTVTVSDNNQYPKQPRRFTNCQALGSQGFSTGFHYWEISTKESNVGAVGVASSEISQGDQLGRNNLSWCIEWNSDRFVAWHNKDNIKIRQPKPDVVGVLLDGDERLLSFYSIVEEVQTLLHTYKLPLNYLLFPAIWLSGIKKGNSLSIIHF
ncbi:E3 ubiquitin-protein ligase RNF135 isoform X2 [Bombina bombina]|uniref:E3 ubiquitin-protein ligase RNF135 isoform X2 n=1 Tax=Bombina bombina TaxID=8345 RepID=UPI00235AE57D|nr:E3 ubiquitin-protein ligase RNF135 isoform X2 [Bombina bombina]